jgi:predicted metalloprotease with PDZ domain
MSDCIRRILLPAFFLILTTSVMSHAADLTHRYTLSWEAPQTHEYHISLSTAPMEGTHTLFQLPAWRPGRYILQDFAAGVSFFEATDENGLPLNWQKTAAHDWRVENPASGPIAIRYRFYANVMDAGSSLLNAEQAYFNGINLFMRVAGRETAPCILTVPSMPANWKAATALQRKKDRHNVFYADSYHQLVDSPTILSPTLTTLRRKVEGVDYYVHFQGNFLGDEATKTQVLDNVSAIVREQAAIFGGVPLEEYHFIFQLVPYPAGHAVEHEYSSMYMRQDSVFASKESANSANGVISHEFFHLWNVKRIRPAAMWPYDYQREAYTGLQWFTEGVTDYYASLTLVRAGLMSRASYLRRLSGSITRLENDYAASIVSPYYSSFDSWLSRSNYENPAHRNSYYSLGNRVGLLLDLELRGRTDGAKSLDDVFRYLYEEYYQKNEGVPEDGVQKACEIVTGESFASFFEQYVKGTAEIDYEALLKPMGLQMERSVSADGGLANIGISRTREISGFWEVQSVIPGSDASQAGLSDGLIILTLNGQHPREFDADAFFADAPAGKVLVLDIYDNGTSRKMEVAFSGRNRQYSYQISEVDKMSRRQRRLLEGWLGG